MIDRKEIKKLLKGAEVCLIATDNGLKVEGDAPDILTVFSLMVRHLREDFSDEMLKRAFESGFKTDEELLKESLGMLKEAIGKLGDDLSIQ